MCHYCDAIKSTNRMDQENGHSLNCEQGVQSCNFCGEKNYNNTVNQENSSTRVMPSISPTASLSSSDSSLSSCSDMSTDANYNDRGYVEEISTDNRHEDSSSSLKRRLHNSDVLIKQNGFHQSGSIVNGEVIGSDSSGHSINIETPETELHEAADNNNERADASVSEDIGTSLSNEVDTKFWLPPEPEDQEDDVVGSIANYDDDDDECGDGGTWARPTSLVGEENSGSIKFKEEKLKAMDDVRSGKFMALVSQLIKSVGVDSSGNNGEDWVDIVTSLSWEAAAFVKPDAQEGKAMDPDGYVKVKCIAGGSRTQSQVIKGLVFKKHAAHKHMPTKYKNPRLLLINGSLELSSSGLSSFQSMQQEKDTLKSIIEMIEKYHPNVILVEKSVSRDIQESILTKGMTLVFDMKLHRLERVARCIGSPISFSEVAPGQKLRQCDSFHIEKFVEEHAASTEGGKKLSKTLMFLEGAPSRLGCTILLMGANSDELKRIKCVVRCAVVMAYHLMLETSFLLDQSAMFSTISPGEVVNLALTDIQPTSVDGNEVTVSYQNEADAETNNVSTSNGYHITGSHSRISSSEDNTSLSFEPYGPATFPGLSISTSIQKVMNDSFPLFATTFRNMPSQLGFDGRNGDMVTENIQISSDVEIVDHGDEKPKVRTEGENLLNDEQLRVQESSGMQNNSDSSEEEMHNKDKIRSVLDSESILVLMSSRNALRGTICEQRHFSHIKFYRSFDVPLGKFLRDNLLNQRLQCKTCAEWPEAHFFYYAHHNKQLTIQVRRLPLDKSLPGETEGKLWMWSRCGQCKLHDGSSKSTKRVLISTAAGGLSFGKFLELSFSDHSSFKGPSSCGHSFHKDFLYFFGLGPMVAMFKYSQVATYSVALPPQKMEFNSSVKVDFLKKDYDNVLMKGTSMFLDIEKSLKDLGTRYVGRTLSVHGSSMEFSDIVEILKQEKSQFEVDIQNAIKNGTEGYAVCNLLRLNRIRLELLLESCVWDQRLHALLTSGHKVIDTDSNDSVAREQGVPENDGTTEEESGAVDIYVQNCDNGAESACVSKIKPDTSFEKNESQIKEISIEGEVDDSRGHNPTSIAPTVSGSSENGFSAHDFSVKLASSDQSMDVEDKIRQENLDLSVDKTIPITTDTALNHTLSYKRQLSVLSDQDSDKGWMWAPFTDIRREYMDDLNRGYLPKIGSFSSYASESMAQKLITDEGSKLHIPLDTDEYIVSDYEDEFSSIIACALTLLKDETEETVEHARRERGTDTKSNGSSHNSRQAISLNSNWSSFGSVDASGIHSPTSTSFEESHSSSFDGLDLLDSLVSYGASHPEVSMGLGKYSGKRKYSVVCLYSSQFRELRARCCPSEVDYIASLSRCKNWDAKGGKSKSFFAKTLDDRFIIKEIKRTEFDSFMKFAPNYFEYMNQCYELGNQTCLAKILGIYQVVIRATRNGKETRHDLLVMENLSFGRHIARQYDLKGALHSRFSAAGNGSGDVLLDQNFVNDMNVSPLYVSRKSKRNLQRAVYNDTNFLNSINVMDYSLLVGVDTRRHELVCGIIDYLRQYTWDKQLENWVKSSLVVPKNQLPTIISPKEYKKRFRKFIDTHFLSVPDHWCSQRSSNPCRLCGPAEENVLSHTKSQKRGNQDEDSSCATSRLKKNHDAGSLTSSQNGKQNGVLA